MTLAYPPDWTAIEPRACTPGSPNCIIRLSHSPSEDVKIEIIRFPSGTFASGDIDKEEQVDWTLSLVVAEANGIDDQLIKTISRTKILVDGKTAIRRVYEYPMVDLASLKVKGFWYIDRIIIMNGEDQYYFEMRTSVEEEFKVYQTVADQIVNTIVFLK